MFALLGLSWVKWAAVGLGALLIVSTVTGGVLYVRHLNRALAAAQASAASLETALTVERGTVVALRQNIDDFVRRQKEAQAAFDDLARREAAARGEVRALSDKLARHDLGRLAVRRPGLIEKRINDGTAAAIRRLNEAGR